MLIIYIIHTTATIIIIIIILHSLSVVCPLIFQSISLDVSTCSPIFVIYLWHYSGPPSHRYSFKHTHTHAYILIWLVSNLYGSIEIFFFHFTFHCNIFGIDQFYFNVPNYFVYDNDDYDYDYDDPSESIFQWK